jgi:hypothetical protein
VAAGARLSPCGSQVGWRPCASHAGL